jgi:hypothetical protein
MSKQLNRPVAIAAAFGLGAAMAVTSALAYEGEKQQYTQPQEQEQLDSTQVTETKIEQFVEALVEVQAIREEVATELESTANAAEAQQVQQQSQVKMIEAIESTGLTLHEYNQIASMMHSDPELKQRIDQRVSERS